MALNSLFFPCVNPFMLIFIEFHLRFYYLLIQSHKVCLQFFTVTCFVLITLNNLVPSVKSSPKTFPNCLWTFWTALVPQERYLRTSGNLYSSSYSSHAFPVFWSVIYLEMNLLFSATTAQLPCTSLVKNFVKHLCSFVQTISMRSPLATSLFTFPIGL